MLVAGAATLAMTSDAPWLLSPSTPSLPPGLYLRTGAEPDVGSIVAFRAPGAAIRYKRSIGERVDPRFLFMKPVIAGPGDHVCSRDRAGLVVNGARIADITRADRLGRSLPLWQGCTTLGPDRYFTFSDHVPNSFDSRHYGPVMGADIRGVYRMIWRTGS
jgi:type IV secretory pathway protease TraF